MIRRPPSSTRTDTLFPYTTLFRAVRVAMVVLQAQAVGGAGDYPGARMVVADVERHAQLARRCVAAAHVHDQRLAGEGVRAGRHRLVDDDAPGERLRSEEQTSELQSLMRISYAVYCLEKKR